MSLPEAPRAGGVVDEYLPPGSLQLGPFHGFQGKAESEPDKLIAVRGVAEQCALPHSEAFPDRGESQGREAHIEHGPGHRFPI